MEMLEQIFYSVILILQLFTAKKLDLTQASQMIRRVCTFTHEFKLEEMQIYKAANITNYH